MGKGRKTSRWMAFKAGETGSSSGSFLLSGIGPSWAQRPATSSRVLCQVGAAQFFYRKGSFQEARLWCTGWVSTNYVRPSGDSSLLVLLLLQRLSPPPFPFFPFFVFFCSGGVPLLCYCWVQKSLAEEVGGL